MREGSVLVHAREMKRGAVCAALPRTSVFPKTIIAFCRYIADHTAVTMIATSNTQKRPWPTVCTHGGCNTPWWHDGVPAKHSVGMSGNERGEATAGGDGHRADGRAEEEPDEDALLRVPRLEVADEEDDA